MPGTAKSFTTNLLWIGAFFAAHPVFAGDWPQILGPDRNGIARDEKVPDTFPAGGVKKLWSVPVGQGYAGPAVSGSRAVGFHRVGDQERVEAFEAATGKRIWQTDFAAEYQGGVDPDTGPRCVPLIHDGAVYLFGAAGGLHCVSLRDGAPRWSRNLWKDYQAPEGYFGAGSTPIVEGESLLVNVGGRNGAGLIAVRIKDGQTVWKASDERASYSSPTAATIDGQRHVIFVTRMNVVSVDPTNGTERFRLPFGKRGPTVNAATPLVFDGHLFVSASYGVGAVHARIGANRADVLWADDTVLSSHYPTPIHHDGHLYGIHGRADVGVAALRCVEATTGKVRWSEDEFGMATLILADGKLLAMKSSGQFLLIRPDPAGYDQLAEVELLGGTVRALPALSDGRLLVRNEGELACFELVQ